MNGLIFVVVLAVGGAILWLRGGDFSKLAGVIAVFVAGSLAAVNLGQNLLANAAAGADYVVFGVVGIIAALVLYQLDHKSKSVHRQVHSHDTGLG